MTARAPPLAASASGGARTALTSPIPGSAPSPTQHEVLQNVFKILLNLKDQATRLGTSAVSPGATASVTREPAVTGSRMSCGSARGGSTSGSGCRKWMRMQGVGGGGWPVGWRISPERSLPVGGLSTMLVLIILLKILHAIVTLALLDDAHRAMKEQW